MLKDTGVAEWGYEIALVLLISGEFQVFAPSHAFHYFLRKKVPLLFPIHHTIIQTVGAGSSPAPICTADLACYPAPPCLAALPWKMCILRLLT